jgi:hypothetical protein
MPSDNVLELVFSFLLDGDEGRTNRDLQLAAQPACRLLQTRRMRGFEHVKLELHRKGLKWALKAKEYWERAALVSEARLKYEQEWVQTYKNVHYEADRLRLNRAYDWQLEDFRDPPDRDPDSAFA